jgi:hypothetical protein
MTSARAKDIAALLLVLIVAALARLHRLDAVEFFHDEAMVSMMAQEMADGQTFPLQGILSSVGIPNPPASIYVMALPFAFSSDPLAATGYIALLNVAGVGLLWLIARRYFEFTAALVAGLMFALNPWAVLYSRKIWAQDYVNPFMLLALTAALWGYRDGKRWGQLLALPLMLFAMQIHFAGWALVPLFAWVGWTGRRNIYRGAFTGSVILGLLILLPYLVGFAQTLQADPTRISDVLDRSGGAREGGLRAVVYATQLATGTDIETWVAPHVDPAVFGRDIETRTAAILLASIPLLVGILALVAKWRGWWIFFALWVLLPVVVFQIGLADIWPHYFVPQLPAFALIAGLGVSWVIDLTRRDYWLRIVTFALLIIVIGRMLLGQWGYFLTVTDYAYTHNIALGSGTSGYTTPLFVLDAVRNAIPADIDDVIVLSDGDRVWFDAEAARWPVVLRDDARCVRSLPPDGMMVTPTGRFAVITTPTVSTALHTLYPGAGAAVIPARAGEGSYRVALYDSATPSDESLTVLPTPALFANGVALSSYQIVSDRVLLRFTLPDAPDRTFYGALDHDYQFFIHLLDSNGERIVQIDDSFWPGRHWCAGDQLTLWRELDTSNAGILRVGFYKLLDAETGATKAVDVLDAAGNAAGNWVDIRLENDP